jgi:protein-S-isoprenylcysteine O-methyltransferase Ste14
VRFFSYLALVVFFFDLPVPIYWLILHPGARFWRRHVRAAFYFAGLGAWTAGGIFVVVFRRALIEGGAPSILVMVIGTALVAVDFILFYYAGKHLGHRKLVGHAELTGKTELTREGMYRYARHPRYSGMILAVLGACLLAGTRFGWVVGGVWLVMVMGTIFLEEREMRERFGREYEEYCRAVPRFGARIMGTRGR